MSSLMWQLIQGFSPENCEQSVRASESVWPCKDSKQVEITQQRISQKRKEWKKDGKLFSFPVPGVNQKKKKKKNFPQSYLKNSWL